MEEVPEVPKLSAITGICRKAIHIRNELAEVVDRLPKSELYKEDNQVRAALKAMDDAIAKLQDCGEMCPNSLPLPKKEPISTASLTLFERAVMFQSWERKRKNSEQPRPSVQQQKAVNSQM